MSPIANVRVLGGCSAALGPVSDSGQAISFVDNALLTHGRPRALSMPEVWPTFVPDEMRYLTQHKGEWIFTKVKRDSVVCADAVGEQLAWTEEGTAPMKRIGATLVGLGLPRPAMPPMVKALGGSSVASVVGMLKEGSGVHPAERTRYVRIAYETKNGVLPPCPAGAVLVAKYGQSIQWSWTNVPQVDDVVRIMVFAGYTKGDEAHVASLNPGTTTWLDLGTATDSGVMATDYETTGTYQYVYTLLRQVGGFIDESGPSPVSQKVSGQTVREVVISADTEKLLDGMPDVVTWGVNDGAWQILGSRDFEGYMHNVVLLQERTVGVWSVDLAGEHDFFSGEAVVFKATLSSDGSAVAYRGVVSQVLPGNRLQMSIPDLTSTTSLLVAPGSMFVVRQMSSPIEAFKDGGTKGLFVKTAKPHPWKTGDKVFLRNIGIEAFDETASVAITVEDPTGFYLTGSIIPVGHVSDGMTVYTSASYFLHRSSHPVPPAGTMIEITMDGRVQRARVLSGMVSGDGVSAWLLDQPMWSVKSGTGAVRWSASASFIVRRRIFRCGTTGEWRMVAELPMDVLTFRDSVPDNQLGEVIATYYQNSLGFVVYDAPPRDLSGLRFHAGSLWGISGNTVRASEPGFPDAWPDIYQWSFSSRPQHLESYNGALIVFCSDAVYRIDGDVPEHAVLSVTQATDGCMAPDSVVIASGRILYIGRTGLMAFDGNHAVPVAHGRIPDSFWRMPSIYSEFGSDKSIGNSPVIPSRHTASYQRVAEHPALHETGMGPVREILGPCMSLAAFSFGGKYVAYWRALDPEFMGNGCVIVDLLDPQTPVTTSGMRIIDAYVDAYETPWVLLQAALPYRLNSFAMAYTTDYPNTPYTLEGEYDPWSKTYFYGPTRPEDLAQLPAEIWITTRRGHGQFTLMHTRIRDGELLNPELGEDTEYVVSIKPQPPAGTWVVEQPRNINYTIPGTVFRVLKVALTHGGNSDNPIEIPEGTYTIEVSCKLDPSKCATAIVHVTKDWDVACEAAPGVTPTLQFISDVPVEPGVSINKLTLRAWPTVDFGGVIGVWDAQHVVDELQLWFKPTDGAMNGAIDFGIEHMVAAETPFAARFTDSRAIYTTAFGGVRRQFAFYQVTKTIRLEPRYPGFRPSSAILGTLPGMSWHRDAKGTVRAAGGVMDAYTTHWSTNLRPEPSAKSPNFYESGVATRHPKATSSNPLIGLWKMSCASSNFSSTDGTGVVIGPENVKIMSGGLSESVNVGTVSPGESGCSGWSLQHEGHKGVYSLDLARRRMSLVGNLPEPKIRPILNEDPVEGALHIVGGNCYLQPNDYGSRKTNVNVNVNCSPGPLTSNTLDYPSCGKVSHGLMGMGSAHFADGGQDSRDTTWFVGSVIEGWGQDSAGIKWSKGPIFHVRGRQKCQWFPTLLSRFGHDVWLSGNFVENSPETSNTKGPSFHMLDGRKIR